MTLVDAGVTDAEVEAEAEATERFNQALTRLAALAGATDVRDLLLAEGVTGVPGDPTGCPVARWLERVAAAQAANVHLVNVDTEHVKLWLHVATGEWRLAAEWRTSEPVADFVRLFDTLQLERRTAVLAPYLPLLDDDDDAEVPA